MSRLPILTFWSRICTLCRHGDLVTDLHSQAVAKLDTKPDAGPEWFNLPKTNLTPELKRDLQLLRMRGSAVLDPKRHYKKDKSRSQMPNYSQVGTIVEGPTEFYSARLTGRERKTTLVGEAMEMERASGRLRAKYADLQAQNASGKKGWYKGLVARRKRS
jgi:hypothetical protein